MRCILHIGTEKTATTLLQDWLYANRAALSQRGVYLSDMLEKSNNRLFPAYFNSELDDWAKHAGIRSHEEKARHFQGFEDHLAGEIRAASAGHDAFIITSEHLHSRIERPADIARIRDFLRRHFANVTVIGYFRSQADMAVSLHSTALKLHSTSTLEEFLARGVTPARYYYNFEAIAGNWADAFGQENCRFRIFEHARFPQRDIRRDFLEQAGLGTVSEGLDFAPMQRNQSLPALRAAAYRQINRSMPYWDEAAGQVNPLNIGLKKALESLPSLDAGSATSPRQQQIFEAFRASNAAFLRRFIPDAEGFAPPPLLDASREPHFTQAEVERIITDLCAVLLNTLLPAQDARLRPGDGDQLRDIALRIEAGASLGLDEAIILMALARRARPGNEQIRRKLDDYQSAAANPAPKPGNRLGGQTGGWLGGRLGGWLRRLAGRQ